uniref:Uncharacterized protein n=1 Tax=Romanomermis culicivorax TaxID=13658 RepID=A0A915JGS7_ROMCU
MHNADFSQKNPFLEISRIYLTLAEFAIKSRPSALEGALKICNFLETGEALSPNSRKFIYNRSQQWKKAENMLEHGLGRLIMSVNCLGLVIVKTLDHVITYGIILTKMVKSSKKKISKANNTIIFVIIGIFALSIIVYYNLGFNFDIEKFKSMSRNVVTSISKMKTVSSTTDCLQFIIKHTRKCLIDTLKKEPVGAFWKSFNPAIDKCTHFLQKTSRFIKVENGGDYKFIILPNNVPETEISKQSCHLLTL